MFLPLVQIFQCGQMTTYNSIKPFTEKRVPNVPVSFVGTLTKLQKATTSFIMSVQMSICLSVHMEKLLSHWIDYHVI